VDKTDNELITLEVIHQFVEVLDRYFGNVCELGVCVRGCTCMSSCNVYELSVSAWVEVYVFVRVYACVCVYVFVYVCVCVCMNTLS